MPRLRVFRTFADAFGAVARNAHWLLLFALPLLALHAYTVMLVNPLIRVAFVNSFLKPADALERGGYSIKLVHGLGIVPGPGYSFPPALTIAVFVLEAIALIAFVALAQKRLLVRTSNASEDFTLFSRLLAVTGLVGVLLAFLFIFVPQPELIGIRLPASVARIWLSQFMPAPLASLLMIVFCLLAGWALIKGGNILLAIASNDRKCLRFMTITAVRADFWRTIGLSLALAISFGLVQALPPLLEKAYVPGQMPQDYLGLQILVFSVLLLNFLFMRTARLIVLTGVAFATVQLLPLLIQRAYFETGQIPLGFRGVQIYALSALVLEFWFILVFFMTLLCVLYLHYRAQMESSVTRSAAMPSGGRRGGIETSHPQGAPIQLRSNKTFGRKVAHGAQ